MVKLFGLDLMKYPLQQKKHGRTSTITDLAIYLCLKTLNGILVSYSALPGTFVSN